MLQLKKPLIFGDFETTGVNIETDRIVSYSFCKILPNGERIIKTVKINPGIPIPAAASDIHGIKDEDVQGSPRFEELAVGIHKFIEGCDLAGYNSNRYDYPLLYAEFCRSGKVTWDYSEVNFIDVGNIYVIKEPRTLAAAYKFYTGQELTGAHDAEVDILATVDVFMEQIQHYDDLPQTIEELDLFCNFGKKRLDMAGKFVMAEDGKTILFNLGKDQKGKPAHSDYGFLNWMVYTAKFPPDTVALAKKIMSEIPFK